MTPAKILAAAIAYGNARAALAREGSASPNAQHWRSSAEKALRVVRAGLHQLTPQPTQQEPQR